MEHCVIFNSNEFPDGRLISLAAGHISMTRIEFKNENVVVFIDAKTGEVRFNNINFNKLLTTNIKTPSTGDEKFSEIKCFVEDNLIKLGFPEYQYKDNYPNCDGEYDRWTKTISSLNYLIYDFSNNCFVE